MREGKEKVDNLWQNTLSWGKVVLMLDHITRPLSLQQSARHSKGTRKELEDAQHTQRSSHLKVWECYLSDSNGYNTVPHKKHTYVCQLKVS